jgi:putative peptidoglycan lipid II flippase
VNADRLKAGRSGAFRALAGAALLIAAVTALARIAGFGRLLVFSRTVGPNCLGAAYTTANQVPNIVFEIVAGGALAGLVVPLAAPLLAGVRAGGRPEAGSGAKPEPDLAGRSVAEVGRIVSALLTWSLLILTPIAVLGMFLVTPIVSGLLGLPPAGCPPETAEVAARMLLLFLPQIPLYGVAVVLSGFLQADRRFLGPALAPLLSSLVVAATYLAFAAVADGRQSDLTALPTSAGLLLAGGTTLGVVVLAGSLLVPLRHTGVRLRPSLHFPPGVRRRALVLAGAGVAAVVGQQLATVVIIRLANRQGTDASVVLYSYAWALYLLPYAILAVPIATSVFPHLSTAWAQAGERFSRAVAASSRAVLLVSAAGGAVLAATAVPVAAVFVRGAPGAGVPPDDLARALVAWAPGLVGYGLVAHLSRVLYAGGHGRQAATGTVVGWAVVAVADVLLALTVEPPDVVAALGLGNAIGMTVAAVMLALAVRRSGGSGALSGLPRTLLAGLTAGVLAALAGNRLADLFGSPGPAASSLVAVLAALVAGGVFAVIALALDGPDVRALLRRRWAGA